MRECPKCSACHEDSLERCPQDGAALADTLDGPVLVDGKYRLERRLSQGGMGVVYLARHVDLQRIFALKLIRSSSGWDHAQLVRFRLEAETLGRLKHPGIVDVTDFGIDPRGGGLPYLVMERLEGRTLMERCRAAGRLSLDEALPILAAVGQAVDFAHEHGVLHRDLKPANVFLCENGGGRVVKLLDFGLARLSAPRSLRPGDGSAVAAKHGAVGPSGLPGLDISEAPTVDAAIETASAPGPLPDEATSFTPPGSLAGTLRYMAPECFRAGESTVATDTYALGVMAYLMLVGRHPFEGTAQQIMEGHLDRTPDPPSSIRPELAPSLDAALLAPLAKDTARRPPSARAFVTRLETAARAERVRSWRRKEVPRRSVIAAVLSGLLLALTPAAIRLGPLRDLERRSVDARLATLPPAAPDPRLRLVILDEASVDPAGNPLGSRQMADEMAEGLEALFAAGARAVAIDLLLPPAWSRSEAFSRFVLRHKDALTLAAFVGPDGTAVGPEAVQGLTAVRPRQHRGR
jgi:serine/threonine protein kinase